MIICAGTKEEQWWDKIVWAHEDAKCVDDCPVPIKCEVCGKVTYCSDGLPEECYAEHL